MEPNHSTRRSRPTRAIGAGVSAALLVATGIASTADRASAVQVDGVEVITDIAYTDPLPETTRGNLLDLYLPQTPGNAELPLLIWTSGSAWLSDHRKAGAAAIAEEFNPRGYAVAGVSVRSSSQVKFPGQLYDIRAAIRWLRSNAGEYNIDPARIAIMGNSSGGWVAAIAATTSDVRQLDGEPDVGGVSSAVQASVPFFPPTDFLQMDTQTTDQHATYDPPFDPTIVHDDPRSPESSLIGCPIQTCAELTELANPIRYATAGDPPIYVFHGTWDRLLPPGQSESLYEAYKAAGVQAWFTLVDSAGHSVDDIVGAKSFTVTQVDRGGQEFVDKTPPPTWDSIEQFFHASLSRAQR